MPGSGDRWQVGRVLADRLSKAVWADAPGDPVLTGGAFFSDEGTDQRWQDGKIPYAIVRELVSDVDREHAEREAVARFEVEVVCQGFNDATKTSSLKGNLTVSQGSSPGRGLPQLEEVLRQAIDWKKGVANAIVAQTSPGATNRPFRLAGKVVGAVLRLQVDVQNVSRDRAYPEPYRLKASGAGGTIAGTVSQPPARFDLVGVVGARCSAAGGPRPVLPTDGTPIVLAPPYTAASFSIPGLTPGGLYWIVFFGAYDELHEAPAGATINRYSQGREAALLVAA